MPMPVQEFAGLPRCLHLPTDGGGPANSLYRSSADYLGASDQWDLPPIRRRKAGRPTDKDDVVVGSSHRDAYLTQRTESVGLGQESINNQK